MSEPNEEAGSKPAGEADKAPEQETNGSKPSEPNPSDETPSGAVTNESPAAEQPEVAKPEDTASTPRPATSAWLGWWNKAPPAGAQSLPPQPTAEDGQQKEDGAKEDDVGKTDDGAKADDVEMPNAPPAETPAEPNPEADSTDAPQPEQPSNPEIEQPAKPSQSSSWFGLWGAKASQAKGPEPETGKLAEAEQPTASEDVVMEDAPPAETPQTEPQPAPEPELPLVSSPPPKAGSTWAFWSKDNPKKKGAPPQDESGEIAVMGEGSESHPAPMAEDSVSSPSEPPKEPPLKDAKVTTKSTWRRGRKSRPTSVDLDNRPQTPSDVTSPQEATTKTETKTDSSSKSAESASTVRSNLLLPSFTSTYQMKENPSILRQIQQLLLGSSHTPPNHVFRVGSPPKIRKAIAIGVHGFFPATYLRPMIGQPTGTSLRFASLCADAIRKWADANGSSVCEIEKVALEGEGKINERVDNLWRLLLNWIDHIRSADLILIASHSQGVPVSIMLLEKLIDLGIITNAKIGVCAMAGVSLGPFSEYKVSLLGASANELWEFGNPQSQNSQRLEAALKKVLDFGARITFIGSIDDQLVPLDVSIPP